MTATVSRARLIRAEMQALIDYIRENEENAAFIEYCEGIYRPLGRRLG